MIKKDLWAQYKKRKLQFSDLDIEYFDDEEFMKKAINEYSFAYSYASSRIKKDVSFCLMDLKYSLKNIKSYSTEIISNKDIVLEIINQAKKGDRNQWNDVIEILFYKCKIETIREDEVVCAILNADGSKFNSFGDDVKNTLKYAKMAVCSNWENYNSLSKELKNNKEVIDTLLITKYKNVINYKNIFLLLPKALVEDTPSFIKMIQKVEWSDISPLRAIVQEYKDRVISKLQLNEDIKLILENLKMSDKSCEVKDIIRAVLAEYEKKCMLQDMSNSQIHKRLIKF